MLRARHSTLANVRTEKVFTLCPGSGSPPLLLAVVAIGFALGLYVLPYGLGWFVGALLLAGVGALLHLRRSGCGEDWNLKSGGSEHFENQLPHWKRGTANGFSYV
jgi:hypothetical protein